jgi:hypothetical protein
MLLRNYLEAGAVLSAGAVGAAAGFAGATG